MCATDDRGVLLDENGVIDWVANGWPEPNQYFDGDVSTMPYAVWQVWIDACSYLEMMWECP